jgi:hypothetical protein
VVLWARLRWPEGKVSWGKSAEPRWHRVAILNDHAVVAACRRVFVRPLDLNPEVPEGSQACRHCMREAATAVTPGAPPWTQSEWRPSTDRIVQE